MTGQNDEQEYTNENSYQQNISLQENKIEVLNSKNCIYQDLSKKEDKIPFLGRIEEAPQYIIDNIYILSGYRINYTRFSSVIKTLFMVHNETINIWTHLIGCLIAIGLFVDVALFDPFPGHSMDKWPIYFFVSSGMCCMFFSSFYHLFFVKNANLAKMLLRLDYAGIVLLICGSTYPLTYYGFYCTPWLMWFYLGLNLTACFVIFVITMMDFIYTEKYFTLKSWLYAILGLFCATPLFHLIIYDLCQKGGHRYSTVSSFPYYLTMAFVDYAGLFIYAKRFPEKKHPGRFDICGHSHQIMHVSNTLGMIATYFATLKHYHDRLEYPCPSSSV